MKNLFIFAILFSAVTMLSSCKKDYTCDCGNEGKFQFNDVKKKDAEDACKNAETGFKMLNASASCKLD